MRPGNDDLCVCWQHGFDIEVSRMPTAGILLVVWYHVIDMCFHKHGRSLSANTVVEY